MAFYTFSQNNSGGSFDIDHASGIGEAVIVEANTADEANTKAEAIGLYFDGVDEGMDCGCCGDRWHRADESDGSAVPTRYNNRFTLDAPATNYRYACESFVHYANGSIVKGWA